MSKAGFFQTAVTDHHNNLPDGWTPWNGIHDRPDDHINGPVFLRDGTIVFDTRRFQNSLWTWECHHEPFSGAFDAIIGYMPGYVKRWEGGPRAPDDWTDGVVLFNDREIWSQGLTADSIAWQRYPAGASRAAILAYTSTEEPPLKASPEPEVSKSLVVLETLK
jgi:hypothetical protein